MARKPKTEAEREAWLKIYCAVIAGAWACPATEDTHNDPSTDPDDIRVAADGYFEEAVTAGRLPTGRVPVSRKASPKPKR